jgi:hypothetical protein
LARRRRGRVQQAEVLFRRDAKLAANAGYYVAASGDTVVVGAPGDDAYQGALYVFHVPRSGWGHARQVARLTVRTSEAFQDLGSSVAISGNTIVAGTATNTAYVFVRPASGWRHAKPTAKLPAGPAADLVSSTVAISHNTIVVGRIAPQDGNRGELYVYVKRAGGWANATPIATLTASDATGNNDELGFSLAIAGDTIVAGAPGPHDFEGAAYVFEKPSGGWADATQTAELTASDGVSGGRLGDSVAIEGGTVVAGGGHDGRGHQGAVYVFEKPPGGWADARQTAELTNPFTGEAPSEEFGDSVAIQGNRIAAGAPFHSAPRRHLFDQGAVYVFKRATSGWGHAGEIAELVASDGQSDDNLGQAVAFTNRTGLRVVAPDALALYAFKVPGKSITRPRN